MALRSIPDRSWRRGALSFSIAAFVTFGINFSFIVSAMVAKGDTIEDGIGVLVEQSCERTKSLNTGLHIAINIMSAILLAGSNYCMQCVAAPTRSQVDAAHEKRKWLDIGVSSVRNIPSMSWRNQIMWILLCLSSLPLHLLYNSTVLASTSFNNYLILRLPDTAFDERNITAMVDKGWERNHANELFDAIDNDTLSKSTMTNVFNEYTRPFQSNRGTLLFVVQNKNFSALGAQDSNDDPCSDDDLSCDPYDDLNSNWETYPYYYSGKGGRWYQPSYEWLCPGQPDDCEATIENAKNGEELYPPYLGFGTEDIKEVYTSTTPERCKLLFSVPFCWVVVALNLVKGFLMLLVAYGDSEDPLLTIGDAIALFLEYPDPHTESMSLQTGKDFRKSHGLWDTTARKFGPWPRRRYSAASWLRWLLCITFMVVCVSVAAYLLDFGLKNLPSYTSGQVPLSDYGLGIPHADTLINNGTLGSGPSALLLSVLLANSPQVVLSIVYVLYNSLFTTLSMTVEWISYGSQRKGLRVSSSPRGAQRETYFLQLPYRYSIPLIVISGLLHWLISQSLFIVALEGVLPREGELFEMDSEGSLSFITCGWSPVGTISVIVVASVMTVFPIVVGSLPLQANGMPIAGSCSAAIAAACHPGQAEPLAWEEPVKWGAIKSWKGEGLDRCAFSSLAVKAPELGRIYE